MTISRKQAVVAALGVLAIVLLGLFIQRYLLSAPLSSTSDWEQIAEEKEEALLPEAESTTSAEEEERIIIVDVKGAVKQPNVYEMEKNARVTDAIKAAGGFSEKADRNQVNLAGKLKDEMVIYVPEMGETSSLFLPVEQNAESSDLVNINSASSEELQSLPGIGPAKAEAIISYREEQGGFQKKEDLLNVSGIGEKSLEKLKEHIIVE